MKRKDLSIYECIHAQIKEGCLPHGSLSAFNLDMELNDYAMAPGAIDGMCVYHIANEPLSSEGQELIHKGIEAAFAKDFTKADACFLALGEKHRAVHIVQALQETAFDLLPEEGQGALLLYALDHLMLKSRHIECVKYGMIFAECYGDVIDMVKESIRTLGLHDEFTLFATFNMKQWENGNEEIFYLAQHVHGWGRIHAVHALAPDTDDIKDWLLYQGCANDVLADYSALTCFLKSDALARLKENPSKEAFIAISNLIDLLLIEGPVPGISALPDASSILKDYLTQVATRFLTDADDRILAEI